MEFKRCQAFVTFKGNCIDVENLIGLNSSFVFFNKGDSDLDFKIQSPSYFFLKDLVTGNVIPITEMKEHFELINSKGEVFVNSLDLHPENIGIYLSMLENRSEEEEDEWN